MSHRCRTPLWSQHRWVLIFPLPAQCHVRRPRPRLRLPLLAWLHRLVEPPGRRRFQWIISKDRNVEEIKSQQVCLSSVCDWPVRPSLLTPGLTHLTSRCSVLFIHLMYSIDSFRMYSFWQNKICEKADNWLVLFCLFISFFCLFQAQNVNLTLMSVAQLPARMEPLALTSLVITSASVWLRLKVMSTRTCDKKKEKKKTLKKWNKIN